MEINTQAGKHYRIPNLSKAWVEKNNFRFCPNISDSENGRIYKLFIPIYKYLDYISLFMELVVNIDSNDAIVDIVDSNRARYAPFYYCEYGNYDSILTEITASVDKIIKKYGLEEKKENKRTALFTMPKGMKS